MTSERPGDWIAVAILGGAIAYHFGAPGWAILAGAIAVGWAFNDKARRERNG